ncbi:hypothetical protein HII12_005310 [Brettanomyces bruxellensis]|uniref:DNA-directed RNA polymerase III subunit n=1 Tax=Dekkera bruxellensis TaxID=5007 RepID=A0A8H6EPR3_DEKBR|nr:hypothetical protein HII12_005310 [Brettanomyces bruxellensis]
MSWRRGPRILLPFGLDYADVEQTAEGEKLKFVLPINGKPTALEDECSKQFLNFTDLMKNGVFYTGTLESLKASSKKRHVTYYEGGVNDGLSRYSDRFRKKIKIGRSINEHPFILDIFPQELRSVMTRGDKKHGSLQLTSKKNIKKLIEKTKEEKRNEIQERLNNVEGNDSEVDKHSEEEDDDEQFEDDYDDDYNAERYFEDGDDLGGEEEDAGDDEAAF